MFAKPGSAIGRSPRFCVPVRGSVRARMRAVRYSLHAKPEERHLQLRLLGYAHAVFQVRLA